MGSDAALRSRKLLSIVRYYRRRHELLEAAGQGPYRMTSKGAWAASRAAHVYYFMRRLGVQADRLLLDLGSGDGLVACIGGLFTRTVGIEADPELCRDAAAAVRSLGLEDRVSILCGDYLTLDLRRADSLYIYPDKPFHPLEPMLTSWSGRLLVYGPHMPPKRLVADVSLKCGRERLQVYRAVSPPAHG